MNNLIGINPPLPPPSLTTHPPARFGVKGGGEPMGYGRLKLSYSKTLVQAVGYPPPYLFSLHPPPSNYGGDDACLSQPSEDQRPNK
jgi:hypothetical protein